MSQPWKLVTIASFVVAGWLALVPTNSASDGGTGSSQVVNCGPPLVTWIQGDDVGFDRSRADCPAVSRVRVQQAWMTGAIGVAAVAGHAYMRRIDRGRSASG